MRDLVRVEVVALLPTQAGTAVFLGDGSKVIVFYIDPAVGASINAAMTGMKPPRPLTHDLFLLTLEAFGAEIRRAVITKLEDDVYYARLIMEAQNEVMERKIVELDARPSDSVALAVRAEAPIYVVRDLWEKLPNVAKTLAELREQGMDIDGIGGGSEEDEEGDEDEGEIPF